MEDNFSYKPQPDGVAHQQEYYRPVKKPSSCLVVSILETIFCACPFGFIAIYYGIKTNKQWKRGDVAAAKSASQAAVAWCIATPIIAISLLVIFICLFIWLAPTLIAIAPFLGSVAAVLVGAIAIVAPVLLTVLE